MARDARESRSGGQTGLQASGYTECWWTDELKRQYQLSKTERTEQTEQAEQAEQAKKSSRWLVIPMRSRKP
jgi:hypothetical protein